MGEPWNSEGGTVDGGIDTTADSSHRDQGSVDSQQAEWQEFFEQRKRASEIAADNITNSGVDRLANEQATMPVGEPDLVDDKPSPRQEEEEEEEEDWDDEQQFFHSPNSAGEISSGQSSFYDASETPLSDDDDEEDELVANDTGLVMEQSSSFGLDSYSSDGDIDGDVPALQFKLAEIDRRVTRDPQELDRALAGAGTSASSLGYVHNRFDDDDDNNNDDDGDQDAEDPSSSHQPPQASAAAAAATATATSSKNPPPRPPTNADGAVGWSSIHETLQMSSSIFDKPPPKPQQEE